MKKNVIKTAFAAVCVVAAGVSGMKAYNVANQSQTNMLLAENVEALSDAIEDLESELVMIYPCFSEENQSCVTGKWNNGKIEWEYVQNAWHFAPLKKN